MWFNVEDQYVDLDDLATIPNGSTWKYREVPGSTWKYRSGSAGVHHLAKPHDLSTERNRRCWILRSLGYHWCTKTSSWSDGTPAPFLAGNSLTVWLTQNYRFEAEHSVRHTHTILESRTSAKPRKTDLNVRVCQSRGETSAELETAFIAATTKLQRQFSNMDFLCVAKGIKLTKTTSLCTSDATSFSNGCTQLDGFNLFSVLRCWGGGDSGGGEAKASYLGVLVCWLWLFQNVPIMCP